LEFIRGILHCKGHYVAFVMSERDCKCCLVSIWFGDLYLLDTRLHIKFWKESSIKESIKKISFIRNWMHNLLHDLVEWFVNNWPTNALFLFYSIIHIKCHTTQRGFDGQIIFFSKSFEFAFCNTQEVQNSFVYVVSW